MSRRAGKVVGFERGLNWSDMRVARESSSSSGEEGDADEEDVGELPELLDGSCW